MANAVIPEVKDPEVKEVEPSAPKKRGRPKKPASISVSITNIVNNDLPIPGRVLKSGETVSYPAHIGNALLDSAQMKNYLSLKQIKVS